MIVEQLIEELKRHDPKARVFIHNGPEVERVTSTMRRLGVRYSVQDNRVVALSNERIEPPVERR